MRALWILFLLPAAALVSAEPLTLPAALESVRTRSPRLAAARAQAEGAGEAARVAGRLADPTIDLSSENWRFGDGFDAHQELDVFATWSQPLELSGVRGARGAVAAGEAEAARAAQRAVEREVLLDAVRSHLGVVRSRELATALAVQVQGLRDIVVRLERQVAEGYAPRADLLKFRAEAARAELRQVRARVELDRSLARLQVLVGRTLQAGEVVTPELPPPPDGDPETLASAALERLPEVAAARARLLRARGAQSFEAALGRPDLLLTAGWKRTLGLDTAVLGVSFNLPIFARNAPARAQATAAASAAELELRAEQELRAAEVASRVRVARLLAERARRLDAELLQPALGARDAALVAFREGGADVLALVDAERVLAEARQEALDLQVEAFVASVEARLAIGQEALP
jgi:cobalt-zinc-cadmium efflux system outer membrane protein